MDANGRVALGRYLAQLRCGAGIDQQELARRVGLKIEQIVLIEGGSLQPEFRTARDIARMSGANPDAINIFFGEPVPPLTTEQKKLLTCELPGGASLQRKA